MAQELERVGSGEYAARITPLKGRSDRVDVEVELDRDVESFDRHDIVARLRSFFADLEAEAQTHRGDPVALSNALARMEALLADVRYVRDTIRDLDADALHEARVRRLTISEVITVEGTSELTRSNWEHQRLLTKMLRAEFGDMLIIASTGETMAVDTLAETVLAWFTPAWRLTPIRDRNLNPDDYCDVPTGDDGRPVREPAVRIVDNLIRRAR